MEKEKEQIVDLIMNEPNRSSVQRVSKLAKWFEIDLSIKLFGVEIVAWHFPPLNER